MAAPRKGQNLSLADLERLLDSRKTQLEGLLRKKDRLASDLSNVEGEISSLEGRSSGRGVVRRTRAGTGKRPKNAKSLSDTVVDILTKNKKGFSLADLADRVLTTGYKTNSSDFKNVLYQCLYNSKNVAHDEKTGTYKLT